MFQSDVNDNSDRKITLHSCVDVQVCPHISFYPYSFIRIIYCVYSSDGVLREEPIVTGMQDPVDFRAKTR